MFRRARAVSASGTCILGTVPNTFKKAFFYSYIYIYIYILIKIPSYSSSSVHVPEALTVSARRKVFKGV